MILAAALAAPGVAARVASGVASTPPISSAMAAVSVLLAFEVDGVNHSLGPLRRRDGARKRLHAAAIFAVRQNDQGFPSLLFLHQRVGSQKDRVVQRCSGAVIPSVATTPPIPGIAAIRAVIVWDSSGELVPTSSSALRSMGPELVRSCSNSVSWANWIRKA